MTNEENLSVIAERTKYIAITVDELKDEFMCSEKARHDQWLVYNKEHQRMVSQVDTNEKILAHHSSEIETIRRDTLNLQNKIGPLLIWHKILVFIASVFGVTLIGFIWSLLINAVTILPK